MSGVADAVTPEDGDNGTHADAAPTVTITDARSRKRPHESTPMPVLRDNLEEEDGKLHSFSFHTIA